MNNDTDKLLQTELRAFSSHDWEKDGVLSFASILLSFKRNTELQWHIKHDSRCKLIIDSTIAPADIFIPLSKYDHFLQVRIGEDTYLFLFAPAKSSMVELDCLIGAYIKAEMYSRTFPSKKRVSGIENLSFIIRPSEFVGIYGESGIGKSVLINSVLGTIQDGRVSGTLSIEDGCGEIIRQDEISYLPQIVDIPPHLRCEEILQAAALDRSIDGAYSVSDIKDVLSRCSLEEAILNKQYRLISEGQKRRLCIASTLLKKHSKILIADEPTTGLDAYSEEQVMETLRSVSRSGITVLVVTHSVISAPIMDRVLVLKKRTTDHGAEICYDGPVYKERLDIISNALSGKNDIQEQYEPGHEFFFPEMCSIPKQLFQSKKNKCLTNCKLSYFQSIQWFKNVLRVIVRDRKGILGFGTLAAVCALTIQFGTNSYNGNNPENIMLTLFSLAAPWLCAMFAAISVSELNRYYAWEHFSGLRSAAFLFGTVFAHAVPAFCIALIFTFGLFVSPRNCEIVKKWVCRGITADTSEETISNRLWFVKKEDRPDFIETCRDYASSPVNISLWYTPLKRGDSAEGLDKALTYSPIMTLHNDLAPNRLLSINYPLAKHKARELPKSMLYVFCIILLIMWSVSWCGSMIGITSAITLGNAKNAAVSIIVIFLFYVLFSRLFISSREAMSYLQPLAEIPTNMKSIDFQDMGVLIPIICSFVCLGRYTSNLLAYAFTGVSLRYDEIALCGIILVCLLVSFVVLTKKKMSK